MRVSFDVVLNAYAKCLKEEEEREAKAAVGAGVGVEMQGIPRLAQFLVERAIKNPKLGIFLYWYLVVESPNPTDKKARHWFSLINKANYDSISVSSASSS